jgi:serine/threonine protein phosphatase PrpC
MENISLYDIYDILISNNYELIMKCYKQANKELKLTKYEISFSGTTANSIILAGNKLINFNCGDSRSIIVFEHRNKV